MTTRFPDAPWTGKEWESAADAANLGLNGQGYILDAVMRASRVGRRLTRAAVVLAPLQAAAAIVYLLVTFGVLKR